ncbi:MAG TPA: MFS transporter [Puia sp.]|nr:MFS transporter [Puia sp.]
MGKIRLIGENFSTLRIRGIRIYMTGQVISLLGDWMQQTAQAWVVWQLTHKATALGIVAFLTQIPFFLFGPWVGVFSDRFDRRKILLLTQVLAMLLAFILALLIQTDRLVLIHVYILAFLLGTVTAFNVTAEQAFIGDIAGPGNIRKAIALNNTINQLTRLAGPALAGWLIASVGLAPAFWLNGISIMVSVVCIFMIWSGIKEKKETGGGLSRFRQGLKFFHQQKLLRFIILFSAVQAFFGMSIVQLLPAFSSIVLKGNARTLGQLIGSAGAGALVGIVLVLPFVQQIKRSCLAIGGAVMWAGCWYVLFSLCSTLPLAMLCQFMASLGAANVLTLSIGLAQELTPVHLRARILSTFMMIIYGLQPVAAWLVGMAADKFGIHTVMVINGSLMITLPALLLIRPSLHKIRATIEIPAVRNTIA